MRIYYWIHHTGRYEGNSGVQRVCRMLARAFAARSDCELIPVRWNAELEAIVHAEDDWLRGFALFGGPALPPDAQAGQPVHLSPYHPGAAESGDTWLVMPEVPHLDPATNVALPVALDYARYHGMRVAAIFYDLIPLRVPGYESLRDAHALYADALSCADLVLPISRFSGDDLQRWWEERGSDAARLPPVTPILLPEEVAGVPRVSTLSESPAPPLRFLALGTVEPRKNQVELVRAFARLLKRRPDLDLRLDIVGSLHPAVAEAMRREIEKTEERVRLHHFLPEEAMRTLLRDSHVTVFLSLAEGYGLPIAESLWYGKPCLCSDLGAMAEVAKHGGCLEVDPSEPDAIEQALERLATDGDLRRRLGEEACRRPMRRWDDYALELKTALAAAPLMPGIVLIEGSRGGTGWNDADLSAAGAKVHHLHWHPKSQALLPGRRDGLDGAAARPRSLRGFWAVLPTATLRDGNEAEKIGNEAHALGLKLAAVVAPGQAIEDADLAAIDGSVDLLLFASNEERETALARAHRLLPKITLLRDRLQTARDADGIFRAIFRHRPSIGSMPIARKPRRVFYWVQLTVNQSFNTGVQRVTRMLGAALERMGIEVVPVKWNDSVGRMTAISDDEARHLAEFGGPAPRLPAPLPANLAGEWLIIPEVTLLALPSGSNVVRVGRSLGMRVGAVFYDLIPAKMPENYPIAALNALHDYWGGLSESDVVLPISWTMAADLQRYFLERHLTPPAVVPCPLAGNLPGVARRQSRRQPSGDAKRLRLLMIGTWEPRKNHLRFLRAFGIARRSLAETEGIAVELVLAGRKAGFTELDAQIERLASEVGGVTLREHLSDSEMNGLFEASDATVFASWEEGFGLPVLESFWHGLPCLCHDGSSLTEITVGGGALAIDMLDERAIAEGIVRLASEPGLLDRLSREAMARPICDWDSYGRDVVDVLAEIGTAPSWPLPSIVTERPRPLLSCSITTYNRAPWLSHSLPRLLEATRPWRDLVEVVVCDNTSTDDTPAVVSRFAGERNFVSHRNPTNVGMLRNFGVTARVSRGAFIWILGDDDLIVDGAIENVIEGLVRHPEVEMAYMNYAYTRFDKPEQLTNADAVIDKAKPIAEGGANRCVRTLREVAGLNENLFTSIYACAFRRDHALRAYQQDVGGKPFSSLATCVPSSTYALRALQDRPAWWVGEPAVVVNMNVSWLRWALLWHLERMPDLFDMAEGAGIDAARLDVYRLLHCSRAGEWARAAYFDAEEDIREGFSMARLLERCKHLREFRTEQVPLLRQAYAAAWSAGRVIADATPPDELFARYGLVN